MKHVFQAIAVLATLASTSGFASHRPNECPLPPNRDLATHSAHGCLSKGFSVQAEFLWWQDHIDEIDYAFKGDEPLPLFTPFPVNISGKMIEPDFHYDPGVRVAAGYDFGRDNWDTFLVWTYHYNSATDRVKQIVEDPLNSPLDQTFILVPIRIEALDEGSSIDPNWENFNLAADGFSKWQVRLNSVDFEMGYDYFFSHRFSVRPHLGLKAAWLDMHYRVKHNTIYIIHQFFNDPFASASARGKSDYWGVGPRFGLDGYLHIGWGFSLYGKIAGALLYGEYDAQYRIVINNLSNSALDSDITLKQDDYYRLRVTNQMAVGLEWGWCFSQNYFFSLHIGWEAQYWWNQLEIPFFSSFQPDGDLTLSGLDVGLRFDF